MCGSQYRLSPMRKLHVIILTTIALVPFVVALAGPDSKPTPKACDKAKMPACPGGGTSTCNDGTWECKALPTRPLKTCDNAKKPATCPGGGASTCNDGT